MSFRNIINWYLPFATRVFDPVARVPYLTSPTGIGPQSCTYISYEDEQSVSEKGSYALQHHLGGAIIWTINEGYNANSVEPNSLLKAASRAFREYYEVGQQ